MRPDTLLMGLSLAIAVNPVNGHSHSMSNDISVSESTRSLTGKPSATVPSQRTCQDYHSTGYFLTLPPCSGTLPSSAAAGSDGSGGLFTTTTAGVSQSQPFSSLETASPSASSTTSTRTVQASASVSSNAAGGIGSGGPADPTSNAATSQVCSFASIFFAAVFAYVPVLLAA